MGEKNYLIFWFVFIFILFSMCFAAQYSINNKERFNSGTFSDTSLDNDNQVILSNNNIQGTFSTEIIDLSTKSKINSITWNTFPYKTPLPDNKEDESSFTDGNVDMSENHLLLHLDKEIVDEGPDNKPVGYWKFNNNLLDSSGNNLHGMFQNDGDEHSQALFSLSNNLLDIFNQTLYLSGEEQYIRIDHHPLLQINSGDEKTISIWFNPDNNGGKQYIIGKHHSTSDQEWSILVENRRVTFKSLSWSNRVVCRANQLEINKDKWYHVAVVIDDKNIVSIYVNGQLLKNCPFYHRTTTSPAAPVIIGAAPYEEEHTKGYFENFIIFNSALSPEEINTLYNQESENIGLNNVYSLTDSSGNAHSILSHTSFTFEEGIFNNALKNDRKLSISLKNSYLLKNKFTLSSWFKPDENIAEIGQISWSDNQNENGEEGGSNYFETKKAYNPIIVPISHDMSTIVYKNNNNELCIKNIFIDEDYVPDISYSKTYSDIVLSNFHFTHISDNIYIIAYSTPKNIPYHISGSEDSTYAIHVKTFKIDNTLISDPISSLSLSLDDDVDPANIHPHILPIKNNDFAIAFEGKDKGTIALLSMSNNGNELQEIDSFDFETSEIYTPYLVNVGDGSNQGYIVGVSYADKSKNGIIKTISISDTKTIESVIDSFTFDSSTTQDPVFSHINQNIYTITYADHNNEGVVKTIFIDKNGDITKSIIDSLTFDSNKCETPYAISINNILLAVTYTGSGNDGFIKTIKINSDGTIKKPVLDVYEFENSQALNPNIAQRDMDTFDIAYSGYYKKGVLISLDVSSQINSLIIPDFFGLAVSQSYVSSYFKKNIISSPITNDWVHTALTYNHYADSDNFKMYVNGQYKGSVSDTLSHSTSLSSLIFSKEYTGLIDEISVWNQELSFEEIKNLYKRGIHSMSVSIGSCPSSNCKQEHYISIDEKTGQNLNIADNQYVQAQFSLSTSDIAFSPILSTITLDYTPLIECGNGICQEGQSPLNCPQDCCESDGTSVLDTYCYNECHNINGATVSAHCHYTNIETSPSCAFENEGICNGCLFEMCPGCSDCSEGKCKVNDNSECLGEDFSCFCEEGQCSQCEGGAFCSAEELQCINCNSTCDQICPSKSCFSIDPDCDESGNPTNICCGNNQCEEGENCNNCKDCICSCGDGVCTKESDENKCSCPKDCGECSGDAPGTCQKLQCIFGECSIAYKDDCCGNGICDAIENSANCISDCPPICGDNLCTSSEHPSICPDDCCISLFTHSTCNAEDTCIWDSSSSFCIKRPDTTPVPSPTITPSPEVNETIEISPVPKNTTITPTINISISPTVPIEIIPITEKNESTSINITITPTVTETPPFQIIMTPTIQIPIDPTMEPTIPTVATESPTPSPIVREELIVMDFKSSDESKIDSDKELLPEPTVHILKETCRCESDNNECTTDSCVNNVCIHTNLGCGSPCGENSVCNGKGECKSPSDENMECNCAAACLEGLKCSPEKICKKTVCGDGFCEGSECTNCEIDCNKEKCLGNTLCDINYNENCFNAPSDCLCPKGFICDPTKPSSTRFGCYQVKCGDNICNRPYETHSTCCDDCGCPSRYYCDIIINSCKSFCGNGKCDKDECSHCPGDCSCESCTCLVEVELLTAIRKGKIGSEKNVTLVIKNKGQINDAFSIILAKEDNELKGSKTIKIKALESASIVFPVTIPDEKSWVSIVIKGIRNKQTISKKVELIPEERSLAASLNDYSTLIKSSLFIVLLTIILLQLYETKKPDKAAMKKQQLQQWWQYQRQQHWNNQQMWRRWR